MYFLDSIFLFFFFKEDKTLPYLQVLLTNIALGLIRTDKMPALHTSDADVIDNVLHYTTHNKVPTLTARSLIMQSNSTGITGTIISYQRRENHIQIVHIFLHLQKGWLTCIYSVKGNSIVLVM